MGNTVASLIISGSRDLISKAGGTAHEMHTMVQSRTFVCCSFEQARLTIFYNFSHSDPTGIADNEKICKFNDEN